MTDKSSYLLIFSPLCLWTQRKKSWEPRTNGTLQSMYLRLQVPKVYYKNPWGHGCAISNARNAFVLIWKSLIIDLVFLVIVYTYCSACWTQEIWLAFSHIPTLTAYENKEFFAILNKIYPEKERQAGIKDLRT